MKNCQTWVDSIILQAGFHLLDLVDGATGGFPLLFVGFFECIALVYIYGKLQKHNNNLKKKKKKKKSKDEM